MIYLGDFSVGARVTFNWDTFAAGGASITPSSAGAIRIYKDGGTAERSSAAGITDTRGFDSLAGVHLCSIDTSDNTDAGFYAAGSDYSVVLVGATIDGVSGINAVLAAFSIEHRAAGSGGGATAQEVWEYSSRTLTNAAASMTGPLAGTNLTILRGDALSLSLTGLGAIGAGDALWFTVKNRPDAPDSQALIQIDRDTGLLYLNGAADSQPGLGAITVSDAVAGDVTIALDSGKTALLPVTPPGARWDFQKRDDSSGDVTTLISGMAAIVADVTRAV